MALKAIPFFIFLSKLFNFGLFLSGFWSFLAHFDRFSDNLIFYSCLNE